MKQYMKFLLILLLVVTLYSCLHHHNNAAKKSLLTVESRSLTTTLYYSGIIEPFKTTVITCPADGVVSDMSFNFGDTIKTGQPLFIIASEKFDTDYKNALMQYIKAKTDFNNAATQLNESKFLHKNLLISDDDFKAKETTYYTAQLAMIQARTALDAMIKQIDLKNFKLDDLKIQDVNKITQLLQAENNKQLLKIAAPVDGMILMAGKSDGNSGDLKRLSKGDSVKQGDVLAVIGNANGLTIHVNVSEFNINQLQIGQRVAVTGAAFPDFILSGAITGLDRQAQSSQNGLPVFPVEIVVPQLTKAQREQIHMGMSAKVAITINGKAEITIPIKAVVEKNGASFVTVSDAKTGKLREVMVKTGQTTLDSVVIEDNLAAGEKIVVPD